MVLWIFIFGFVLVSMGFAFRGLWFSSRAVSDEEANYDKAVYLARISEIETDFSLGRIDAQARDAAKAEHARKLLKLSETAARSDAMSVSQKRAFIFSAMVFVPVFSLAVYAMQGAPEAARVTAETSREDAPLSLNELLAVAEERLAEDPEDVRGWRAVAPIYVRFGAYEKAAEAFGHILRLEGETPENLLAVGEATMLQHDREVRDETLEIFRRVVTLQPENPRARFFIGMAELQRGNRAKARTIWQEMVGSARGDEPWLPVVLDQLLDLNSPDSALPQFSAEQLEQINSMVSGLADRLKENPNDREGWNRLVTSYMVLQRPADAQAAVEAAEVHFSADKEFMNALRQIVSEISEP